MVRAHTAGAVKRQLDIGVGELNVVDTTQILIRNLDDADDLDHSAAGTMATGHVLVHLLQGTVNGDITVLTIHVVRTCSGIVADVNTKVLHDLRRAVEHFVDSQQLAVRLLEAIQLPQVAPEHRLGLDGVLSEHAQLQDLRRRILGRRGPATQQDILVLQQKQRDKNSTDNNSHSRLNPASHTSVQLNPHVHHHHPLPSTLVPPLPSLHHYLPSSPKDYSAQQARDPLLIL